MAVGNERRANSRLHTRREWCLNTSLSGNHARVIEQEVPERVAVRVDGGLAAQARRVEVRERLQRPQSGLAFRHRRRRAGHCEVQAFDC